MASIKIKLLILLIVALDIFFLFQLFSIKKTSTPKFIAFNCASSDFPCYKNYYTAVTRDLGIKEAFDDLKGRYKKDSFTRQMCHPLVHVIGRTASEKFKTPGEAFTHGDGFCWSGYYHGVLEGIVGKIGRKNLISNLNIICKDIKDKKTYGFNYYNCVHGLGHGVMALTDDELLQSLNYCDQLIGDWEQFSCARGVFMENVIVDGTDHKTKYLNPNEPLYPCTAVPTKYKDSCYSMQTSYMMTINNGDFKKTFKLCSGIEAIYRNTCYSSLGRDASGWTISDVNKTRDICLLGVSKEQQLGCLVGAARDFISYFHSDEQAKNLCNSFDDPDLRKNCLATTSSYYSQF